MEEEEKFYGEREKSFESLVLLLGGHFFHFLGLKLKELMRKQYDGRKGKKRKQKLKPRGS
jgi:hypothetical protein